MTDIRVRLIFFRTDYILISHYFNESPIQCKVYFYKSFFVQYFAKRDTCHWRLIGVIEAWSMKSVRKKFKHTLMINEWHHKCGTSEKLLKEVIIDGELLFLSTMLSKEVNLAACVGVGWGHLSLIKWQCFYNLNIMGDASKVMNDKAHISLHAFYGASNWVIAVNPWGEGVQGSCGIGANPK